MNARLLITAITILGSHYTSAQNVVQDPKPDPVLDAIQDFSDSDTMKPVEIASETLEDAASSDMETDSESSGPVLVTGPPPADETTPISAELVRQELAGISEEDEVSKPETGLVVRIERMQGGLGSIDPKQVKLLAPFPAKPLAQAPAGWHLDASDSAPPFTREVEFAPGSKITLNIRPHVLVPDADGASVFTISEPGYDHSLGYQQSTTVGAILSNSIRQLDEDSKKMGVAIDNLQQLLISLPKPELQEVSPAEPPTKRKQ